jgi:hypothetical protein
MMSRGLAWPLAALLTALPLAATFADGGPAVPVRVGIHEATAVSHSISRRAPTTM